MRHFKKLFKPISLKGLSLKNRIVMPPMRTDLAFLNEDMITDRLINYYAERAKGGAGLIIVEHAEILPLTHRAKGWKPLYAGEDKMIPQLKILADVIHQHGARAGIQLIHWGRLFSTDVTGAEAVAPSPIPVGIFYTSDSSKRPELPKELTVKEIEKLIDIFADAVQRVQKAGFDMVELHFGHGYLVHQFFSPYTNKRTDEYGGTIEGRTKFGCAILQRVKEKSGDDFPVSVRISGDEYLKGGMTLHETQIIAQTLEKAGADFIHVSAGTYPSDGDTALLKATSTPPMSFPRGCFVHLAEGIKKVVNIPVIAVGRINDPDLADEILIQGKADLVSIGRGLISDPELPQKAMTGKSDEIRKCIGCNCCIDSLMSYINPLNYVKCSVNAASGNEKECLIKPANKVQKVLIIGGGPAGMEAARIAALRGHTVTLHDKAEQLGGTLNLAVIPPHKNEIQNLIDFLSTQVTKLNIEVKLNSLVTSELVDEIKPDIIIIASGASPVPSVIPGSDRNNVITFCDVLLDREIPEGKVIIIGGGLIGCETAEFLSNKGWNVCIVEALKSIASDVGQNNRPFLLQRLYQKKIKILTQSAVKEIFEDSVLITDKDGNQQTINGDTMVLATGLKSDQKLFKKLKSRCSADIYTAGDCIKPRRIRDAIYEGFNIGNRI